jgi:TolB-like protein
MAAGGSSTHRKLVKTLPKRGYLLASEIKPIGAPANADTSAPRSAAWRVALLLAVLLAAAGGWWLLEQPGSGGPATGAQAPVPEMLPYSIAVLPFVDLSPEQDQKQFTYGISEELLNRLADHGELNVIARTSSFAFQDSDYELEQISALLGVQFLLEGSVSKEGQKLRISVQLSNASGQQLWSESYDQELGDIFTIQDEIAQAVVTVLCRRWRLRRLQRIFCRTSRPTSISW